MSQIIKHRLEAGATQESQDRPRGVFLIEWHVWTIGRMRSIVL